MAARVQDIENAVALTLNRAMCLEKVFKSQIEDKTEVMSVQIESEEKLKMLIYNICREIKQIFKIFMPS